MHCWMIAAPPRTTTSRSPAVAPPHGRPGSWNAPFFHDHACRIDDAQIAVPVAHIEPHCHPRRVRSMLLHRPTSGLWASSPFYS